MVELDFKNIGKYELIEEVGRGGMGVVYLGHDPFADRKVAIKIAHPESLQDQQQGARYRKLFFNEAKAAGMLKHPNIIQVFDAGVEEEISFIVMEYVAGDRTFHDHCKPHNLLPIEDVVRLIFKCARALDYAHRQGVVHRDIKPRNVLLTEQNDAKIGDFSIALITRADATETQVHGYVGSPLYMSPEQIQEENISNQTDVFAIGVLMYEMLTGVHPFSADSLPAIIHKIQAKPHVSLLQLRSDAPEILGHIIDRTLMKDPAGRYKTGLDVAADLSLVFDHLKLFAEELSGHEKYEMVKALGFFNDFSESEIWEVVNAAKWLAFEPGDEIISEGDIDNSFFVITSGEVRVTRGGQDLDELCAGDCFGEMGFIAGKKRTANIIAMSKVTVLKIRAALMERASLQCQLHFHRVFLNTLVERLSHTTRRVSDNPV